MSRHAASPACPWLASACALPPACDRRTGSRSRHASDALAPPVRARPTRPRARVLRSRRSRRSWGTNAQGQLGTGDTVNAGDGVGRAMGDTLPAIDFGAGATVHEVRCGYYYTCVRSTISSVTGIQCWGRGDYGMLGYESTSDLWAPGGHIDLGTATAISQWSVHIGFHGCVVFTDALLKWCAPAHAAAPPLRARRLGAEPSGVAAPAHAARVRRACVRSWGRNNAGQLGDGTTTNKGDVASTMGTNLPYVVVGGSAVEVAVGDVHTCLRLADDSVKCWGQGGNGRLGTGSTTAQTSPTALDGGLGAGLVPSALSVGSDHSCALLTSGEIKWCAASRATRARPMYCLPTALPATGGGRRGPRCTRPQAPERLLRHGLLERPCAPG